MSNTQPRDGRQCHLTQHKMPNLLTDAQFQACEDKIDKFRRNRAARTADETLAIEAWDEAFALPQIKHTERVKRDTRMYEIAVQYDLLTSSNS